MMRLKTIRTGLWIAVGVAALGLASHSTGILPPGGLATPEPPQIADIGGAFRLTTHRGETLTDADMVGKPHAVFFGFTHCPEVCPTTLYELSVLLEKLGPAADGITPLFITVDPERDTQEVLAQYMEAFDSRIIGLTGRIDETAAAADAYKAYFKKVPLKDGGYTMDHTSVIYLMNSQGEFTGTLDFHEKPEVRLAKLRRLLNS